MKSRMQLYKNVFIVTFWKAKDTKGIICIAAFIIAMVSIISSIGESVKKSYLDAIHNTSQYDFMIIDSDYENIVKYADSILYRNKEAYVVTATMDADISIPDTDFYINVVGLQGHYEQIYQFDVLEGRYPQKENEILLDCKYNTVSDNKYRIGDKIELEIPVFSDGTNDYKKIEYQICGFFNPPHSDGYELHGLLSFDGGKSLLERMQAEERYVVLIKAGENSTAAVLKLLDRLDEEIEESIQGNVIFNETRMEMLFDKENNNNGYIRAFKGLGVFIGVMSFALLFNMFQMTTIDKIQQLGLLRSIGMNKKQLAITLFLNMLFYLSGSMLFGFVIFIFLESIFGNFLMRIFMDSFNVSQYVDMQWHLDIMTFVKSAVLILFIMAMVYLRILVMILRMTPLEAIRYNGEIGLKANVKAHGKKKEKPIVFLGKRNLFRNGGRTLYTALTMFVMSVCIITVSMILGCLDLFDMDALRKSNLFDYEFYGDRQDAFVDRQCIATIEKLETVESICMARRAVYDFFQDEEAIVNSDKIVETRIYCDELFERICKENKIFYERGKNTPIYFLLSKEIHEAKQIILYNANHEVKEVPIKAVITEDNYCDTFPSGDAICLVMNEAAGEELMGAYKYNVMFVASKEKEVCLEQMLYILEENGIQMYFNDLKMNTQDVREQLKSIVCIVIYLLFCIGIMTIANIICNININIRLRSKEYGILLAMGMERTRIVQLIIFEIMYVTEMALFGALPCGLIMSVFCVTTLGTEINFLKLFSIAAISSLLIYGVTYGICYLKGNREFGKNIMQLMQSE